MSTDKLRIFSEGQIEQIAKILGHTTEGLSGSEIQMILQRCSIPDTDPANTKWKRLYNALASEHNKRRSGNHILSFISKAMEPSRFAGNLTFYHYIISQINVVLAFHGIQFQEDGKFYKIEQSSSLTEAESRAESLSRGIKHRNLHHSLLVYCQKELLQNNYFHAVLEATKGVADMVREKAKLTSDGAELIDQAFGGADPILRINSFSSETEKSEQRGFVNLLKGFYGTFRNPTAHAPRKSWPLSEEDALDLFSLASYILRRIEAADFA